MLRIASGTHAQDTPALFPVTTGGGAVRRLPGSEDPISFLHSAFQSPVGAGLIGICSVISSETGEKERKYRFGNINACKILLFFEKSVCSEGLLPKRFFRVKVNRIKALRPKMGALCRGRITISSLHGETCDFSMLSVIVFLGYAQ